MTSAAPPSPPTEPISKEKALEIARKAIHEIKPDAEFVIVEDRTLEKEYGWVFAYTTKKYLETQNPSYLVPGNGPLVVLRATGEVHYLTTSVPPERAIEGFEKRWREGKLKKAE